MTNTNETTRTRKTIRAFARAFAKDECGATAIEYGLFAALIGAVIVGTVATLGTQTNTGFPNHERRARRHSGITRVTGARASLPRRAPGFVCRHP